VPTQPERESKVAALVRRLDAAQRHRRALAVPLAVVRKLSEDQGSNLAALVSYYFFFSLFPLLLVFTTVTGFFLADDPELRVRLLDSAMGNFPVIGQDLEQNIGDLGGSGRTLAVGLLVALWAGLSAGTAMQNAMNILWDVPWIERPTNVTRRLRSLTTVLAFGIWLVVSVAVATVATRLPNVIGLAWLVGTFGTLAPNIAIFAWTFRHLPARKPSWRTVAPGSVVAGVVFTGLQAFGAVYVNRVVVGASNTYGTFSIVIGLLAWLYLQAQVAVAATALNVTLDDHLWPRSLSADDETDADRRARQRRVDAVEFHETDGRGPSSGPAQ